MNGPERTACASYEAGKGVTTLSGGPKANAASKAIGAGHNGEAISTVLSAVYGNFAG